MYGYGQMCCVRVCVHKSVLFRDTHCVDTYGMSCVQAFMLPSRLRIHQVYALSTGGGVEFWCMRCAQVGVLRRVLYADVSHSSSVEDGRCSGNLVRRRLEQSTTFASQRHLAGHTGLLLHS